MIRRLVVAAVAAAAVLGLVGTGVAAAVSPGPAGPVTAPGGPFLHDRYGRVVFLHGVDLVYKVAPYEVTVSGHGVNVLRPSEVRQMAGLGFDAVRLGIIWKGLEPGHAPMNDPAICRPGRPRPGGPGQFDRAVFDRYVRRLDATIALLGRYGIYSLLDMHQDVYAEPLGGEGAPDWAVCTDGIRPHPVRHVPDWSVNLRRPAAAAAYRHFWRNDVVGNLQGAFDDLWARLAAHYRANPWVLGYDPFNEPYAEGLPPQGENNAFDAVLQCFYAGRADPGTTQEGGPVSCPPDVPVRGVIPRIEAVDPVHPVFYETDFTTDSGIANHVGPMPFPRLVLNFHDYCFEHVPNGPEPPGYASVCSPLENLTFNDRSAERARDAVPQQPGGPGWLLTEFGATPDATDVARVVGDADAHLVGWIYWQWLHYDDPTGNHVSGLHPPDSVTPPLLDALSEPYAQAVAGTPSSMSFDGTTGTFSLTYQAQADHGRPTVVYVPLARHYAHGYCPAVTGGARVVSPPGAGHLVVANPAPGTVVGVTLTPGSCRSP